MIQKTKSQKAQKLRSIFFTLLFVFSLWNIADTRAADESIGIGAKHWSWNSYNPDQQWTNNSNAWAYYQGDVSVTGDYRVVHGVLRDGVTSMSELDRDAQYVVYAADGTATYSPVDQTGSAGTNGWTSGVHCFVQGSNQWIMGLFGNVNLDNRSHYTYMHDNITLEFVAARPNCTEVRFNITPSSSPGGSIAPSSVTSILSGGDQAFTFTPDAGYALENVQVDGNIVELAADGSYTFESVLADHTIYAQFSSIIHPITATSSAGGAVSPPGVTNVVENNNQTFTFAAEPNFIVNDILVDGLSVFATALSHADYTFFQVVEDHEIEVKFVAGHTITPTFGAGGSVEPSEPVDLVPGADQVFSILPNACYILDDVMIDGASVGAPPPPSYEFTNVSADHSIEASFVTSASSINITSVAGVHSTISPEGLESVSCSGDKTYTVTYNSSIDQLYVYVNTLAYKVVENGNPVDAENVVHNASDSKFTITVKNIIEDTVVKLKEVYQLSDYPLDIVTRPAPPNIMFVLDDSGSMDFEFMTTESGGLFSNEYYVFNTSDRAYDSNRTLDSSQRRMWKSQWFDYNKLYYNPSSNYQPWAMRSADDMTTASTMRSHPIESSSRSIDAASNFTTIDSIVIPNAHYYVKEGTKIILVTLNYSSKTIKYYEVTSTENGTGSTQKVKDLNNISAPAGAGYVTGRTFAEEMQNWANWFTFYRKRELAATAAISLVIDQVSNAYIGIRTINSSSSYGVRRPVTPVRVLYIDENGDFVYKNEVDALLTSLYSLQISAKGTPLRSGLNKVGQYFDRTDSNNGNLSGNPWFSKELGGECQQSFSIAMTDGFYNGSDPSDTGNEDQHKGVPYADGYSDTLADVAMKYYDTDLVSDTILDDKVAGDNRRQHVNTYTVAFGVVGGLGDPENYTLAPGCVAGGGITCNYPTWPNPEDGDSEKIDDMFHAAVNGRGLYLSASSPQILVKSLLDVIVDISDQNGSSASVSVNGDGMFGDATTGNLVLYQTQYVSPDWIGKVYAYPVSAYGEIDTLNPIWEAGAKLDIDLSNGADISSRVIATMKGDASGGVAFDALANLTSAQQAFFNDGTNGTTEQDLFDYIRGSNAKESVSLYRQRTSRLGDIVNSGALHVDGYLYAGANDGMLHAFDALTGAEKFAYIPSMVMPNLKYLAAQNYGDSHKFFVDDTPVASRMGSKIYLVGGLGRGGKGYYSLDISTQSSITTAAELAGKVLWEYPQSDTPTTDGIDDLGFTYSRAFTVKSNATSINSGDTDLNGYVTIFGNGYGSAQGNAVLYFLNPKTGILIKKIDVGGSSQNGMGSPAAVDVNDDNKVDYIYGGDLEGNMWKFDLTDPDPDNWQVSYCDDGNDSNSCKNTNSPRPLVTIQNNQAITSTPDVIRHPTKNGYMIVFGSGRFLSNDDWETSSTQSMYGIWDWGDDGDDTEYLGTVSSSGALSHAHSDGTTFALLEQTELYYGQAYDSSGINLNKTVRVVSNNIPNWNGVDDINNIPTISPGDDPVNHSGWFFDLPLPGERVTVDAMIRGDKAILISFVPNSDRCAGGANSLVHELNVFTGGRLTKPAFDVNGDGKVDGNDTVTITVNGSSIIVNPSASGMLGQGSGATVLDLGNGEEVKVISSSDGSLTEIRETAPKRGIYFWREY
ncbi:MAG: PilC/PilY family type IV pilus protein [Desulfotalea sp.]